jgi:hypothetical protein
MKNLTKKDLKNDKELLDSIIDTLDLEQKQEVLKNLQSESIEKDFWEDNQRAQEL